MQPEPDVKKTPIVVSLVVRDGCGSCVRVEKNITPVVDAAGARLEIINIADDVDYRYDYGDRVPVVLINDEEFACWECDADELRDELRART